MVNDIKSFAKWCGLSPEKVNKGCVSSYFAGTTENFVYFINHNNTVQLEGTFTLEQLELLVATLKLPK
jgi:hypothetical protein